MAPEAGEASLGSSISTSRSSSSVEATPNMGQNKGALYLSCMEQMNGTASALGMVLSALCGGLERLEERTGSIDGKLMQLERKLEDGDFAIGGEESEGDVEHAVEESEVEGEEEEEEEEEFLPTPLELVEIPSPDEMIAESLQTIMESSSPSIVGADASSQPSIGDESSSKGSSGDASPSGDSGGDAVPAQPIDNVAEDTADEAPTDPSLPQPSSTIPSSTQESAELPAIAPKIIPEELHPATEPAQPETTQPAPRMSQAEYHEFAAMMRKQRALRRWRWACDNIWEMVTRSKKWRTKKQRASKAKKRSLVQVTVKSTSVGFRLSSVEKGLKELQKESLELQGLRQLCQDQQVELETMREELDAVKSRAETTASETAAIADEVKAATAGHAELSDTFKSMEQQIETLQIQGHDHEEELSCLEESVAANKTAIKSLEDSLAKHQQDIGSLTRATEMVASNANSPALRRSVSMHLRRSLSSESAGALDIGPFVKEQGRPQLAMEQCMEYLKQVEQGIREAMASVSPAIKQEAGAADVLSALRDLAGDISEALDEGAKQAEAGGGGSEGTSPESLNALQACLMSIAQLLAFDGSAGGSKEKAPGQSVLGQITNEGLLTMMHKAEAAIGRALGPQVTSAHLRKHLQGILGRVESLEERHSKLEGAAVRERRLSLQLSSELHGPPSKIIARRSSSLSSDASSYGGLAALSQKADVEWVEKLHEHLLAEIRKHHGAAVPETRVSSAGYHGGSRPGSRPSTTDFGGQKKEMQELTAAVKDAMSKVDKLQSAVDGKAESEETAAALQLVTAQLRKINSDVVPREKIESYLRTKMDRKDLSTLTAVLSGAAEAENEGDTAPDVLASRISGKYRCLSCDRPLKSIKSAPKTTTSNAAPPSSLSQSTTPYLTEPPLGGGSGNQSREGVILTREGAKVTLYPRLMPPPSRLRIAAGGGGAGLRADMKGQLPQSASRAYNTG